MKNPFSRLFKRNMVTSTAMILQAGVPAWKAWTVRHAVKEGMKENGWVYRAVSIIARNAGSIPWGVKNKDTNEWEPGHPISILLNRPNPQISRLDLFQLLLFWQQLAGRAYVKKVRGLQSHTKELWPLSPDRIAPIPGRDPGILIEGYAIVNENGVVGQRADPDYPVEDVVYFRLLDPADPISGLSPLEAAARAVDVDSGQQEWNLSANKNRGVLDTIISFKQELTADQHEFAVDRIKERFSGTKNARVPMVLGNEATAQRLGLTPAEMDWIESRKQNREEIWVIFGIPLQLGAADFSSYNNFETARRVLWEMTLIPLLEDLADTFNASFGDELTDRYEIAFDLSNVEALRDNDDKRSQTAERYWRMGVPIDQLNQRFELGIEAFPGSDQPWTGGKAISTAQNVVQPTTQRTSLGRLLERRDYIKEQETRDRLAEGPMASTFQALLDDQRMAVEAAIETGEDIESVIRAQRSTWLKAMNAMALEVGTVAAGMVAVGRATGRPPRTEVRDEFDAAIQTQLEEYLQQEQWMLEDLSHMEQTTAQGVVEQIRDGLANGMTTAQIQAAIQDLGLFTPARALMLARTLAGTAASVGQLAAAQVSGAQKKTWMTSLFGVRDAHVAREGETVDFNSRFSDQGYGAPRYPLDPILGPADRVNCRCSMTFG